MSRISDDEREYIEQFRKEYRAGYKVFAEATSQEDKDAIREVIFQMERYELEKTLHQEARARPPLTFDEASLRVKKNWLGRKNVHVISQIILNDDLQRTGGSEDIAAHAFKISLDVARSRRLILDSEIPRKFKECTEKTIDLETKVHQLEMALKKCQDDFKAYRDRVQPLGKGRTERGATEAAPSQ